MSYPAWKKKYHRKMRLLFPSPAEVLWAEMMGAICIRVRFLRRPRIDKRYRYPLTIIIPWGWYRENYIEREIHVAGYQIDFGNRTLKLGIEIDGRDSHANVLDDYHEKRREILAAAGWTLLRFPAAYVVPRSPKYRRGWVVDQSVNWFA